MFLANTNVKVHKMKTALKPSVPTSKPESYLYGQVNLLSPPIDYWMTGFLFNDLVVGEPMLLVRDSRNGVKIDGHFISTRIKKIELDLQQPETEAVIVSTENSIYRVEKI